MSIELIKAAQQALDALEEIALAGMSGTGQESEEGMRDWHARQAWKFIGIAARALDPLRTAIQQAESEPVAWLDEMLADTKEVFDANGTETPQVVRDVIEYVASWITVYNEKRRPSPGVPDGYALVPVEPTAEMKSAGIKVEVYSEASDSIGALTWAEVAEIYRAMLAASPAQKGQP